MGLFSSEGARTGLYFGATSGVITTLGLLTGLSAGTQSLAAVFGGICIIAVADALSDALGIHLAEESDPNTNTAHVWAATVSTFANKFLFAISFTVPLLLLPLDQAVIASLIWGAFVIVVLSWLLARAQSVGPLGVILEHVTIAAVVVVLSYLIGGWVRQAFG